MPANKPAALGKLKLPSLPGTKGLPELAGKPKRQAQPKSSKSGQVKFSTPKGLNYQRIKDEVMAAIAQLPRDKQALIPTGSTLPEAMVALALVALNFPFQAQASEAGGRLRIGGSVVDFLVFMGASKIVIRVQGSYWHSLPDRKVTDLVQWDRLHRKHYRIFDAFELALYQAFVDGGLPGLKRFVEQGVMGAS